MDQDALKKLCAEAALAFVEDDMMVGVGTGSTVNHFIDALAARRARIDGTVSSSEASARRLREAGIPVMDLNATDGCDVYVDGADEVTEHLAMIKGGGGALTREKIVAQASRQVRLHRRRLEARPRAREVPAAGRGDPDGAEPRGARDS